MPGFSNAPNPLRPQPGSTPQSPPGGEPAPFRPVAPVARPVRQGGKSRRRTQKAGRNGPPARVIPRELLIPLPLNLIAPPGFQASPERGALIADVRGTPAPPGFSTRGGGLYYPEVPGYEFIGHTMDRPGALSYQRIIGGGRRRKRSTRRRK